MVSNFIDFIEGSEKKIEIENQKEKNIFVSTKLSLENVNIPKTKEEKILLEKRKRYQVYKKLEYTLSTITYFDFYSTNAFKIALNSKYLAQSCERKIATSELLLLPFLASDSSISKMLNSFELNESLISDYISEFNRFSQKSFQDRQINNFKFFFHDLKMDFFLKEFSLSPEINYSKELNNIFEKSAENALIRFKTPVVTSEILFLTMMEEKHTRVGKIIKTFIKNEADWYLLRFKLLKLIHSDETGIRSTLKKNQYYFGYLLKTQLSESQFKNLLENNLFSERVSVFRNKIIRDVLNFNLTTFLYQDIHNSIKLNNKRKYSI